MLVPAGDALDFAAPTRARTGVIADHGRLSHLDAIGEFLSQSIQEVIFSAPMTRTFRALPARTASDAVASA